MRHTVKAQFSILNMKKLRQFACCSPVAPLHLSKSFSPKRLDCLVAHSIVTVLFLTLYKSSAKDALCFLPSIVTCLNEIVCPHALFKTNNNRDKDLEILSNVSTNPCFRVSGF